MWFQKKEIDIQYVIVAPFDRVTADAIQDELVDKLKSLLENRYKIVSATGSLDGAIHYVLTRPKQTS